MLSQSKNRVQAIKSKFENLTTEADSLIVRKKSVNLGSKQLNKHNANHANSFENYANDKENTTLNPSETLTDEPESQEFRSSHEELPLEPNSSYLYSVADVKRSLGESKTSLTRQSSDPGKKLHRSHAFRCDRSQKIPKECPKRHGSCNGRSESSDFALKMGEKRLSKDRLKKLGNLLEDQMRKENYKLVNKSMDNEGTEALLPLKLDGNNESITEESSAPFSSLPDESVPQHILDQYAKVVKPKKKELDPKQDAMTDSGVSSETENQDDEKNRIKKLKAHFETDLPEPPLKTNLVNLEDELCGSSETMKLEKKNPHLTLTDTLKKALKQPLPPGPPPRKPPRSFNPITTIQESPETKKKDTREMLQKLEQVLLKREAQKAKNVYDIAETNLSVTPPKPKEMHYLCTEILDITQRTLLPNTVSTNDVLKNCFNSLNCAVVNNQSMTSLPYTRLSTGSISNRSSLNICCSCSTNSLDVDRPRLSTFKENQSFKCHLKQTCKEHGAKFFVQRTENKEHIYDVPFGSKVDVADGNFSGESGSEVRLLSNSLTGDYGVVSPTLNRLQSRSMEELSHSRMYEEPKIYDIPCDASRPATPDSQQSTSPTPDSERPTSSLKGKLGSERPKIRLESNRESSRFERPNSGLGFEDRYPLEGHRGRITNFEQRKSSFEALTKECSRNRASAEFEGCISSAEATAETGGRKGSFDGLKSESGGRSPNLEGQNMVLDAPKGEGRTSPFDAPKSEVLRMKSVLTKSVSEETKSTVTRTVSGPISNFDRLRLNFENANSNEPITGAANKFKTVDNLDLRKPKSPTKGGGSPQRKQSETTQKPPLNADKPQPLKPKPMMVKIPSDSKLKTETSNLSDEFKSAKKNVEKKFATEARRYKKNENVGGTTGVGLTLTLARREKNLQLDVDKENLNRLMNELYDTVTAACRMDDQPRRFPTEPDSTSEDSVKLTRSLTEKRKTYVRRVSSKAAYLDPRRRYRNQTSVCSYTPDTTYSTFRSWKSFRHSRRSIDKMAAEVSNDNFEMADNFKMADLNDSTINLTDSSGNLLSMKDEFDGDDLSLDKKAGCLDFDLPFEPRERGLFDICLLVGLNYMTGEAYVKSVFPNQVKVPAHIENLVFPETISVDAESKIDCELSASKTQSYSLVLTDEKGERSYGYCRRVVPEGATACLPLCYCLIARYRAPGFYYKVLKEIESHHGSSEVEINTVLQQLFETDFPNPGEQITLHYRGTPPKDFQKHPFRNSVNLGDVHRCKTLPDGRRSNGDQVAKEQCEKVPDFYDLENNNGTSRVTFLSVECDRTSVLRRPIDPRTDEGCLSVLLDTLGAGLLIKVFSSLLLERKVVLMGDDLSQLSSCIEALQATLYPLVWQHPLISALPAELRSDMLEAPLPLLAGSLRAKTTQTYEFDEGMLIDISTQPAKVLCYQGDESTILPTSSYKTLKTTLQMESSRHQLRTDRKDEQTRNVMISEAFLRFFVDILAGYGGHFVAGVERTKHGDLGRGDVVFQREAFIAGASSKQHHEFLEWFTETAMFGHFVQNMAAAHRARHKMAPLPLDYSTVEGIIDAPLPNYYEMFDGRLVRNTKKNTIQKTPKEKDMDGKNNYKGAVNRKVNKLKMKLKDFW